MNILQNYRIVSQVADINPKLWNEMRFHGVLLFFLFSSFIFDIFCVLMLLYSKYVQYACVYISHEVMFHKENLWSLLIEDFSVRKSCWFRTFGVTVRYQMVAKCRNPQNILFWQKKAKAFFCIQWFLNFAARPVYILCKLRKDSSQHPFRKFRLVHSADENSFLF